MKAEIIVEKLSYYDNAVEFYMNKHSSEVTSAYDSLEIP